MDDREMALRPLQPRDHAAVMDLNDRNEDVLAPMGEERLFYLLSLADRTDVVDVAGHVAGFVMTFTPGIDYDSGNYAWFTRRFGSDFYYIDRVVIDERFRRRGLARLLYDDLDRAAAPYGRLTCEISVDPPNTESLAFHTNRGFVEVGRREDGPKTVVMLSKTIDRED